MAFSAFRLMMGAGQSSGPVVLTDTVYPEVGSIVDYFSSPNHTYGINGAWAFWNGSSTKSYINTNTPNNDSTGYYERLFNVTEQTGGPTLATTVSPTALESRAGYPVSGDYFSAIPGSVAVVGSTEIECFGYNNSQSSQFTYYYNLAATITNIAVAVFNSSNDFFVATLITGGTCQLSGFVKGTGYINTVSGPSGVSTNLTAIGLTTTLGMIIWNDSSNLIHVATVNTSSGTVSVDSAVSSTITAASSAKAVMIDSSHVLFIYKKSANTLGARVVTVATGSTFTFGTEYTVTVTGITDDPIGKPGQFTSSGDYIVTCINGNGQGIVILMSISGSTIEFNTPYVYHNANNVNAMTDTYSSEVVGLSSTTAMIRYGINTLSTALGAPTTLSRSVIIDLNYSLPTWGATYSGNTQAGNTATQIYPSGVINFNSISIGLDRVLSVGVNSSTSINLATSDLDYAYGYKDVQTSFTAAGTVNGASLADLGFSSTSTTTRRALMGYGYSGTTVAAVVVSVDVQGTITVGTPSTIDSSASSTNNFMVTTINYTTDTSLILSVRSTGVFASIVTTSGTTISSSTTPVKIYNLSSAADVYVGYTVIDSNNIALAFKVKNTNTAIDFGILNISGSTLTMGTTVQVGTLTTTLNGTPSICILTAGRGIISYTDNILTNKNVYGVPFTYSGTTVTLGTAVACTTDNTVIPFPTNMTQLIAINTTEAMLVYGATSTTAKTVLLTSTSISSLTAGTEYNNSMTAGLNAIGFVKQENNNKLVVTLLNGSFNAFVAMTYRV